MLNTLLLTVLVGGTAGFANRAVLQKDLQNLAASSDGKLGVCALDTPGGEPVCAHGSDAFPLQSVMKLVVGAAVMDAVDSKLLKLDDSIILKPEHISPGPTEFAELIRKQGQYTATVEELIRRSIVDSDSTSVDRLLDHIGGVSRVQDFLKRKKVEGIRIDRKEQDLQAEFSGLAWKAVYADEARLKAAVAAVPAAQREQAWNAYLKDPRDTATPAGMVKFLRALAAGQLLSAASTQKLIGIMEQTATGADRLKAGLPANWKLAHKTGTSASWKGRVASTNDVGLMTAPDGSSIAIAVFLMDSKGDNGTRAALIAKAAQLVTAGVQASNKTL